VIAGCQAELAAVADDDAIASQALAILATNCSRLALPTSSSPSIKNFT